MEKIFFAFFVLTSIIQLYACYTENKKWRSINKPFILANLLVFYLLSVSVPNYLILAAVVCSLAGDILLIFKKAFYVGGILFLAAHICFVVAFSQNINPEAIGVLTIILMALAYLTIVALESMVFRKGHSALTAIVSTVYLLVLGVMNCVALLQCLSLMTSASLMVFIGSSCFFVSDSILCLREFRKDINVPKKYFWVMLTYVFAEGLIVCGMIGIG
ncbi:MAG: lysoplasmalogenase [Oscillospiraceae bacterium]